MDTPRKSPIVDESGDNFVAVPGGGNVRYESMDQWMGRHWEAAETTRLNEAHWVYAEQSDRPLNDWLGESLSKVRGRCTYEARNNGTITGMVGTLADDVVGPDGPALEVQSSSEAYNNAAERAWREWFRAPTFRPNVSGASLLRLWVENLPRCGEFLAQIDTDDQAEGPVKMRLRPKHPRDLATPVDHTGDGRFVMGIEFNNAQLDRPLGYWINKRSGDGYQTVVERWAADLVIHEFFLKEEQQARGYPWLTPSIQPAADLRDYDDQVQDAARQMADQAVLLYSENPEEPWMAPESSTVERRTIKMAPPGWKPFVYQATQPPVQYPDYRAERQREIGRPMSMPLMIMRLDASNHNYSSARFDGQGWARFVQWIQTFFSGSSQSCGTLNRLVDVVLAEARFDDSALRNPPPDVALVWTWTRRPHVDPLKEAAAAEKRLVTMQTSLTQELADAGRTLDSHIATLLSEKKKFEDAGLPLPAWMRGETVDVGVEPDEDDEDLTAAQEKEIADAK